MLWGNARSGVAHLHEHASAQHQSRHVDVPARWCVGYGVVHEGGQRLAQLGRVAFHEQRPIDMCIELQLLLLGQRSQTHERFMDNVAQVEQSEREHVGIVLNAREFQ